MFTWKSYWSFVIQFFKSNVQDFEVLIVDRIHNAFCVRTLYSLVQWCECFGRIILGFYSQAMWRWKQYDLKTSVPSSQIRWSHNQEDYNFQSLKFCIFCVSYHCSLQYKRNTLIRHRIYHIILHYTLMSADTCWRKYNLK